MESGTVLVRVRKRAPTGGCTRYELVANVME
jgi:hypothetical protein